MNSMFKSSKRVGKRTARNKTTLSGSMMNNFNTENIESLTSEMCRKAVRGMYATKGLHKGQIKNAKNKENQAYVCYKSLNQRINEQTTKHKTIHLNQTTNNHENLKTKVISHKNFRTKQNSPNRRAPSLEKELVRFSNLFTK